MLKYQQKIMKTEKWNNFMSMLNQANKAKLQQLYPEIALNSVWKVCDSVFRECVKVFVL